MSNLRPCGVLALSAALVVGVAACGPAEQRRFQGWVEADLLFIGPDEPGRLEKLSVQTGDQVEAGASLFAVDADLQEADLRAGKAAAAEARARLARLEAAQQRPAEIAVLEAQLSRVQASLVLSTAELERQQALASRGIASTAQVDTARANHNRDRAMLEEVQRQIEVANLSSREEDIAAARQALAAAEAKQSAAMTKLARRHVASPVGGTVQQLYYRAGEYVPAGKPVIALLPPGNLKVRFYVPEPLLQTIVLGATADVHCDGCAPSLTARVDFIARSAEFTPPVIYSMEERAKLVFLVEAVPAQPEALRVGQPVSVSMRPVQQSHR